MKKGKEITIYDLARELKISVATVSRALKDDPVVSKKTKKEFLNLQKKWATEPTILPATFAPRKQIQLDL
ncbi:LacI family DNA-binding transcriptional regulator [Niabella ginsengisoli]|uniref:LacI family DNA-binding transcriptional regulator n=1 Tax=Niabella ginsengisoli TaxID=522298 RepID=A0ABS9SIP6_9BACT|nr:LacI family DNA-binding transcriptional regulator [Niabella ginsengisoli]MCH5598214.1 LacI family DNA-binding transcriptional regulator [Niabella ginsengisoli]